MRGSTAGFIVANIIGLCGCIVFLGDVLASSREQPVWRDLSVPLFLMAILIALLGIYEKIGEKS